MQNVYWGVSGAMSAGVSPSILAIGDSWLWYPIDNLATEIGAALSEQALVVIGYAGSEAAQWNTKYRKDIDYGFKIYGNGVSALLLSGGGNDVAGMSDFLRILNDNCSTATKVVDCYREGQPDAIITTIISAYKEVIHRFRGWNANATVFMHNYEYAWPTGKGLFGPADWLKAPMVKARVPHGLRRDLFRDLLNNLRKAQLSLAKDKSLGKLVALKTAGTMPDGEKFIDQWWANELHPTPAGFKLIANKVIVPELRKLVEP